MRKLIVHRQRALAMFAMKYHCVLDRERETFLAELKEREEPVHLWDETEGTLANGQTVSFDIGEGEHTLFVVACLEGRDLATETVAIPAGTADTAYVVVTDYDGNRRLGLRLLPAEQG